MSKTPITPIQTSLTVSRKEYITPHYIRVFLTGDDVVKISNTTVGVNNKILIPPKGVETVVFPEFDYEKRQWKSQPEAVRPTVRTYTHRGIDLDTKEIWIDFVAHGDEGPASGWAIGAKAGDRLGVLMKDGKTDLYPQADHYLLVGDATAIPVLGAILEDLPATAKGTCVIEVHDKEDEQPLHTKAAITFIWLHNEHPQQGSQLAQVVQTLPLPVESRFAYVAAEFSSVQAIRQYLKKEKGWTKDELYAYAYWKSGVAEDKSATERHAENNND
ncbi:NADPH-dependent ferric siderophore reductase [Siphonobacter sp. SORGH_AS_0500]|uniref:siderophore-interacting protein n=1 Tax=Siphonobacter sp. SORGH_AS_0500 TaxID=1864824 RepID=UPI000CC610CE|nr:siderophore-interacting protein [Siphonobacter sp. SORGH_AS_0500]PKK36692.1 NADPH-dependent ferric siderophore reductase [Siphonobacter sp. SORGH_AS_0500]